MTAKEFLLTAWRIESRIDDKLREIDRLDEKRERIMARLTAGRSANLTGMPRGGRYDWTDSLEAVIETDKALNDLKEKIRREISDLCRAKREVAAAINAVEDLRYRRVLELRYRNYLEWQDIAERMGYDVRHVTRLHGDALQAVKHVLECPSASVV